MGEPGALLVASISEAMTRRSSDSSASTSWPTWRRDTGVTASVVSRALPAVLLQARACSSGSLSASLAESMSFRVSVRRTSALPLLLLGGIAELAEIAQLAPQMLARIGVLVFAQQAVMQQLGDRWRPRNPFRQRGTSSRQVDSQPLGDYIKTPIGITRASRQAHKLAGQALALERELKMEEAAELFVQAAQLEPSSPEYWARASKVVSDSSYLPGTSPRKAAELNKRALELALKGKGEKTKEGRVLHWGTAGCWAKPPSAHCRQTWSKASVLRLSNTGMELLGPCTGTSALCQTPLMPLTCQHAPAAVEANPHDAFGHVACCVSRGRLAVVSDNRSKAQLARLAQVCQGEGRRGAGPCTPKSPLPSFSPSQPLNCMGASTSLLYL